MMTCSTCTLFANINWALYLYATMTQEQHAYRYLGLQISLLDAVVYSIQNDVYQILLEY